jgi:hypothetical protein
MNRIVAIILFYLSSFSVLYAEMSFEDMYGVVAIEDYRASADQIVSARFDDSELSLQQKYTRLKNLQGRIQLHTQNYADDPMVWFLSGLNLNNLAEMRYLMVLNQSGQQKADADTAVSNHNIARSRAYDNAIRLDSQVPHKLSSAIYATMGYGLSNRQKIKTYTRELELGSPSENESNEWFMHWAKIDALVHEKKLDEAQTALAELKNLLAKKNKSISAYSSIVERAQKQVDKVVTQAQNRKKLLPKNGPKLEKTQHLWNWKIWLVIAIGVFTFVSVLIAAVSMRKRED